MMLRALQLAQRLGDSERVATLHFQLAELSESASVKVVHGTLAGHLYQSQGKKDEAKSAYQLAFGARKSAGKARYPSCLLAERKMWTVFALSTKR